MLYNPIFEEEVERQEELKGLRKSIKNRASLAQFTDFCTKVANFGKKHPIAAFTALAGLVGFSLGSHKK